MREYGRLPPIFKPSIRRDWSATRTLAITPSIRELIELCKKKGLADASYFGGWAGPFKSGLEVWLRNHL